MAPETDAEVRLRVEVLKGRTIRRPRILTADRFMTLASAETLEESVRIAVRDAVDLLVEEKGLTADEAYLLITIKADIEICQVVDPLHDRAGRDGPQVLRGTGPGPRQEG